jgi:glutaminyl-tRNA synthetase
MGGQKLVLMGKAYVDDQSPEEVSANRGTLTEPGVESPYRDRDVEENMDLLERMKNGEFPDGSRVLRAKIDMAHPNINMRDPVMYRIIHEPPTTAPAISGRSTRCTTGRTARTTRWKASPTRCARSSMKTTARCTSGSSNSWACSSRARSSFPAWFELHRHEQAQAAPAGRRRHVSGWDDPRMPTLRGMRRRGYTPEAIVDFIGRHGHVAKAECGVIDVALLEACPRRPEQTRPAPDGCAQPLKLVIDNYPDDLVEEMEAINNPEDPEAGTRKVPFSKVLYIEQDDFREDSAAQVLSPVPGQRGPPALRLLRHLHSVVKDETGEVTKCTAPTTRPRAAATAPMAARSNPPSTGCRKTRFNLTVNLRDSWSKIEKKTKS